MFAERTFGIKEILDLWLREIGFHDFRAEEQEFVDRLLNSSIVPSLCDGNGSVERSELEQKESEEKKEACDAETSESSILKKKGT